MYGLLLRLSTLDADAASALRVISFFDTLVEQSAPIDRVLRSTAALAECPAGIRSADDGFVQVAEPDGRLEQRPPGTDEHRRELASGHLVWLERQGEPLPLDDLVLERFALAATVAMGSRPGRDGLDPDRWVEVAVDPATPASDRKRVLAHLGFDTMVTLHVMALAGERSAVDSVARAMDRRRVKVGSLGKIWAMLSPEPWPAEAAVPVGSRLGLGRPGPAADAAVGWRQAVTALRFTLPSTHPNPPYALEEGVVVDFDQIGAFATVAQHVPLEAIDDNVDVRALDQLAAEPGGTDMIRTLEAVAATESLRRAAAMLHLHHNSVAHRVARAEQVLGFPVAGPYAHARLMLGLVLQRLRSNADLIAPS